MSNKTLSIWAVSLCVLSLFCFSACRNGNQGLKDSTTKADQKTLVVASWGGAYQEAQRKAFFEPFTRETGIKIVETSTPDYGKFYEWQRSGKSSVDVVDVETYFVYQAGPKGALFEIPTKAYQDLALLPGTTNQFGVASCAYADVLAWNTERHPDWKSVTWSDFWDTKQYPGTRGLRDLPASTLEAALLSTGTLPGSLYPLDATKAFNSLTSLKATGKITLWSSGSQPIEWLSDGSVAMSTAWNGRVYDAQKEGLPIAMTFDQGMLDWLWWAIPRNAPNPDLAVQFIAFTLRPDRQAELARHIPYGPVNTDALHLLDDQVKDRLPTSEANFKKLILRDNQWWASNDEMVQPLWRKWKLGLEVK